MVKGSLRSRLVAGAAFWSVGLSLATFVAVTLLMFRYQSAPRILHGFAHTHAVGVAGVAVVCLAAGIWLVRRGVRPLDRLRNRLSGVHAGRDRRVEGTYPSEVQPLVDDLNVLLDHQESMVRRALAKAGDLAHGLKTPLAVLAREAERADAAAQHDLAATIRQQVERMERQIAFHLAHARAAASGATPGTRCEVKISAEGLARTLQRLHAARVEIDLDVAPDHAVRSQREDLDEMLGNLLDNACKWARTRVMLASAARRGRVSVTVDDDGPGLAASMREAVLQRGVRADEKSPGSGLGLAIVRDLAELYGGSISLSDSPAGGLRATLDLPAAEAPEDRDLSRSA